MHRDGEYSKRDEWIYAYSETGERVKTYWNKFDDDMLELAAMYESTSKNIVDAYIFDCYDEEENLAYEIRDSMEYRYDYDAYDNWTLKISINKKNNEKDKEERTIFYYEE